MGSGRLSGGIGWHTVPSDLGRRTSRGPKQSKVTEAERPLFLCKKIKKIKSHAEKHSESVNELINRLIDAELGGADEGKSGADEGKSGAD